MRTLWKVRKEKVDIFEVVRQKLVRRKSKVSQEDFVFVSRPAISTKSGHEEQVNNVKELRILRGI